MKTALQESLLKKEDPQNKPIEIEKSKIEVVVTANKPKSEPPKKKRRGRPSKQTKDTKLNNILKSRGMTRKDLYNLIAKTFPDEPISPDAVSRIVSGSRKYYSTTTLFRICGALKITPNMALNWEEEVV